MLCGYHGVVCHVSAASTGRITSTSAVFQSEEDKHSVQADLAAPLSWQEEQCMVWCGSWWLEDPCVCVYVRGWVVCVSGVLTGGIK